MSPTRMKSLLRTPFRLFVLLLAASIGCAGCYEHATGPRRIPDEEPFVVIERPPAVPGTQRYAEVVVFHWRGGTDSSPDSVRHLLSAIIDTTGAYNPGFDIIGDLNANPRRYDGLWSPWTSFEAPDGSGTTTTIGDDETLTTGRYYVFAVQALNRWGVATRRFGTETNARLFRVQRSPGALLTVIEPLLGGFRFLGTSQNPVRRAVPTGTPLSFRWGGDAGSYGGEVTGYRYGWDVPDVDAWSASYRPEITGTLETVFHAGTHTLTVEAIDQSSTVTSATLIIETIPFPMERNLLWIDDFAGGAVQSPLYEIPSEESHDAFWLGLCGRAAGFDPSRDVYDCSEHLQAPPDAELVGRYKNVIWTYSSSSAAWTATVRFTPESLIGQGGDQRLNYLPIVLVKGGHLWTLGRSDRRGGLAAVLDPSAQSFPMYLACEITGNREDCAGDRSGVRSMPYRDYCVSMIDKIDGAIRRSPAMPQRRLQHYDVMTHAYRDPADVVTARHPAFPARLDLRGEVTSPGRYFDPDSLEGPGGFSYVEIYDPEYWMREKSVPSQTCFHPIYRMRAKDPSSVLNDCAIALWITRYADVLPEVSAGVATAAPSVHFGFPLWFFEPEEADSIAEGIFDAWGILDEE